MLKLNSIVINSKLKKIKLIVMDFDGILTDGGIYLGNDNSSFRRFDVKDGMGIKILQKNSINIALISGSNSDVIDKRANHLGIKIIRKGVMNKAKSLIEIQEFLKLRKNEILFLGDDVNDITILPYVGLFFTPSNGHKSCKIKANYIGKCKGGRGFVREIGDKLLLAKGYNPYKSFESRNEFSD